MAAHPPTLPFDRSLFHAGERVVAAVSGGADSVALLLALVAANRQKRDALGIGLAVAHVHHGIRGADADADAEFVTALAARLELPLHLHHADVPAHAAAKKESLEEAARNVRYAFFNELMASGEAHVIATAHTLDDQAETVLMKLVRGAWTEGLSGIHPVVEKQNPKGRIVRPLLGVRRAEIESWLTAQGQPWREDQSNRDPAHTRNRARAEWLPLLRRENPRIDEALARVALLARDEESRWQTELSRLLPSVLLPGGPVRGGGRAVNADSNSISIELARLQTIDPALRRRVVRSMAERLGVPLGFEHTARLLVFCGLPESPGAPLVTDAPAMQPRTGSRLDLPGGLSALRTARELRLFLAENK
jgi:tRNA(Ile)-lysidine synthase